MWMFLGEGKLETQKPIGTERLCLILLNETLNFNLSAFINQKSNPPNLKTTVYCNQSVQVKSSAYGWCLQMLAE